MGKYEGWSMDNKDRMRRAKSWLTRSENEEDPYIKFILLWIAFDAAYGQKQLFPQNQDYYHKLKRGKFLDKLVSRDKDETLRNIVDHTCKDSIDAMINIKYALPAFWRWREKPPKKRESGSFWKSKIKKTHGVRKTLNNVLGFIYTTRNQMIHGNMTYDESFGISQIKNGIKIMEAFVPAVLKIIEDDIKKNPKTTTWGSVEYSRFRDTPE